MDEHRAAGGDGFVHGGAAGLADNEMVSVEELGDFARPADEADAAGIGIFELLCAGIQTAGVASEHDGEAHGRRGVEQRTAVGTDERFLGGGEIEDAEGLAGVVGVHGREFREDRIHGKAGVDDLLGGGVFMGHFLPGAGIGDEPPVRGCAQPCGVDFDRVGDDGEDWQFAVDALGDAFEEIRVERVGADEGVRLELIDQGAEGLLGQAHDG